MATKQDLKITELNIEHQMQQLEYRIIIKLGALFIVGFTTLTTLLKFWVLN